MTDNRKLKPRLPHASLTESARRERAAQSGGNPVRDWADGSTPYIDYQNIDVLLSLQSPRTNEPAEMTFFIMGQVKELLFKLIYIEACRVRDDLLADKLDQALWVLRRIDEVQRVLENSWDVLAGLSPTEFARFRDELGAASGLGSYMYRQLEFVLGNKSADLANMHAAVPGVIEEVTSALRSPSIWDAANRLLSARGYAIDPTCLQRDWAQSYAPDTTVVAAWASIYRAPSSSPDVYRLGEALSSVAYRHHRWRSVHLLVVERIVGSKVGTGGTDGIAWLRSSAEHRIFPELLLARTEL